MESFTKLFGSLLVFVYHCFDRIVINGYLEHLARPGQVVHFFREVLGIRAITKDALGKRTAEYRRWVEAFARKQGIPMQWAEKRVRERGLRRAVFEEDAEAESLRRLLHLSEHGARGDIPVRRPQVSNR